MKRNIKAYTEEYNRKFAGRNTNAGRFYPEDIEQIIEVTEDCRYSKNTIYQAIVDALKAGFIIGCRYEQRQQKQRNRKN